MIFKIIACTESEFSVYLDFPFYPLSLKDGGPVSSQVAFRLLQGQCDPKDAIYTSFYKVTCLK